MFEVLIKRKRRDGKATKMTQKRLKQAKYLPDHHHCRHGQHDYRMPEPRCVVVSKQVESSDPFLIFYTLPFRVCPLATSWTLLSNAETKWSLVTRNSCELLTFERAGSSDWLPIIPTLVDPYRIIVWLLLLSAQLLLTLPASELYGRTVTSTAMAAETGAAVRVIQLPVCR